MRQLPLRAGYILRRKPFCWIHSISFITVEIITGAGIVPMKKQAMQKWL
jgi:hypothetical protein